MKLVGYALILVLLIHCCDAFAKSITVVYDLVFDDSLKSYAAFLAQQD